MEDKIRTQSTRLSLIGSKKTKQAVKDTQQAQVPKIEARTDNKLHQLQLQYLSEVHISIWFLKKSNHGIIITTTTINNSINTFRGTVILTAIHVKITKLCYQSFKLCIKTASQIPQLDLRPRVKTPGRAARVGKKERESIWNGKENRRQGRTEKKRKFALYQTCLLYTSPSPRDQA